MDDVKSVQELVQYAREYAAQEVDLYELLGLEPPPPRTDAPSGSSSASSSLDDKTVHRAWRRQSLLYHPDKTGDQFDADHYERLGRARDILMEPSARKAYDDVRAAARQRQAERSAVDDRRRRMMVELEAAEAEARRQQEEQQRQRAEQIQRERQRFHEEAAQRQARDEADQEEARQRRRDELAQLDDREAELLRKMQQRREAKEAKEARRAAKREANPTDVDQAPQKQSSKAYLYSTDPKLSFAEKVAGVMGRLRAAQARKESMG